MMSAINLRRVLAPFIVIISSALFICDASAQFGGVFGGSKSGRGGGARGGDAQSGGQQGGGQSSNERRIAAPDPMSYEQVEYRLSLLHDDLKLANEQNAAWQSYAAKTRAWAGDVARERAAGLRGVTASAVPGSGLQQISLAVHTARNRLTALEEVETTAKALYLGLTAEQKGIADARIPDIVSPRTGSAPGTVPAGGLPEMGSGARSPR